jgi:hypothetical protein
MALMRRYRKKAVKNEKLVLMVAFVKVDVVWGRLSSFVGELVSF